MKKMTAETPDVIAFNGYANQYKANPITVRRVERIRRYVLDAGPSKWSAFHVIGTVFDRTYVEGVVGHDAQTVSSAPSQAAGSSSRSTRRVAPVAPQAAAKADVNVTLGDMWVKADHPSFKAGKVTFSVKNVGATMHGLAIVAAPAKVSGGMVDPDSFLAKGGDLSAGASGTLSANLKPGR